MVRDFGYGGYFVLWAWAGYEEMSDVFDARSHKLFRKSYHTYVHSSKIPTTVSLVLAIPIKSPPVGDKENILPCHFLFQREGEGVLQ